MGTDKSTGKGTAKGKHNIRISNGYWVWVHGSVDVIGL